MTPKPTAVVVRLPLSDSDRRLVKISYSGSMNSDEAFDKAILAIGTPVTGGELEAVGFEVVHVHGADLTYCRDRAQKIASGAEGIIYPLIREGDAQAALADAQAEIVWKDDEIDRLWAALESIELSIDALPDDMEDYSKMTAREMQRQALIIVKEEVKALKGPAV